MRDIKQNQKVRYFIVGPTERGISEGDVLWVVCSTTKRCSFHDVYMNDWFVDEFSCGSRDEAINETRKLFGCKRPFVLT
jgi:hypothetical protein